MKMAFPRAELAWLASELKVSSKLCFSFSF